MRIPMVVLGSGPTSVFAVEYLAQRGIQSELVGALQNISILPISTPDGPVSLLPVFPTLPSAPYPPSTPTSMGLAVRQVGSPSWVDKKRSSPNSLVTYLLPDRSAAAMAIKQFGVAALTSSFDQVQEKVQRAYRGSSIKRAGYINGLSPYLGPMLDVINRRNMYPRDILHWRPRDHLIELSGRDEPIEYDKMVYAADLESLLKHAQVEVPLPKRAAAVFSTYICEEPCAANELTYDLDDGSPIFRAFFATPRVLVVQESQLRRFDNADRPIETKASHIFQRHFERFGERVVHRSAYPVESLPDADERALNRACRELDILRFGRNAANRYLDLHELNWEALELWAMK